MSKVIKAKREVIKKTPKKDNNNDNNIRNINNKNHKNHRNIRNKNNKNNNNKKRSSSNQSTSSSDDSNSSSDKDIRILICYNSAHSYSSQCVHCDIGFNDQNVWKAHHNSAHKSFGYKCPLSECGRDSKTWYNFTNHVQTHRSGNYWRESSVGYICELDECKMRFANKYSLIKHWHSNSSHRRKYYISGIPSKSKFALKIARKKRAKMSESDNESDIGDSSQQTDTTNDDSREYNNFIEQEPPIKKRKTLRGMQGIDLLLAAVKQIESEENARKYDSENEVISSKISIPGIIPPLPDMVHSLTLPPIISQMPALDSQELAKLWFTKQATTSLVESTNYSESDVPELVPDNGKYTSPLPLPQDFLDSINSNNKKEN